VEFGAFEAFLEGKEALLVVLFDKFDFDSHESLHPSPLVSSASHLPSISVEILHQRTQQAIALARLLRPHLPKESAVGEHLVSVAEEIDNQAMPSTNFHHIEHVHVALAQRLYNGQ
jgi:hypothetical protein